MSLRQTKLPGLKLQYDIAVSNPSKFVASSVKVAAPVPAGTTVQSAGGGTQGGLELQWMPGTLAAAGGAWNGSYTVAVTAAALSDEPQTGNAMLEAPSELPIPAIESAKAGGAALTGAGTRRILSVRRQASDANDSDPAPASAAAASIVVTVNPTLQQVVAGGTATFEITVRNMGDVQLEQIAVVASIGKSEIPQCGNSTIGFLEPPGGTPNSSTYPCSVDRIETDFTLIVTATAKAAVGADRVPLQMSPMCMSVTLRFRSARRPTLSRYSRATRPHST